jgi:hypothetical protein
LFTIRRDLDLLLGPRGPASRPPATSWPAGPCHQLLMQCIGRLGRTWSRCLGDRLWPGVARLFPKLWRLCNASFECQTVYLLLKIILDPKEFFWSERTHRTLHFLLFLLHRSQKIGWSKELKQHCRYRCVVGSVTRPPPPTPSHLAWERPGLRVTQLPSLTLSLPATLAL